MLNISKLAKEIVDEEMPVPGAPEKEMPLPDETPEVQEPAGKKPVVTTVPQSEIDAALSLANELSQQLNGFTTDVNSAIESLSGTSSPSVLESKDDFKSLVLKLKNMKKKLALV